MRHPLSAHGLCVTLGGRAIVEDVDLALTAGELVALVGPNGAGKTTLVRALAGLLPAARGEVQVLGEPAPGLSRREHARRVAYVAAEEEEAGAFCVRDLVALGRHPWRGAFGRLEAHDRAAVQAALEALGLGPLQERPAGTLSRGERQRVALARALAQEAPVLLLDEPTAHQDLAHRVRVLDAVAAAPHRPAVLAVLHDLTLAALRADRVALMDRGRLVATGSAAEVLRAERLEPCFGPVEVLPHPRGVPLVLPRLGARAP